MKIKTDFGKRKKRYTLMLWIIFTVIIAIAFAISMMGTFIKPLLLIPISISISVKEDELNSAILGAFCGVLLDISCGTVFGYNAVLMIAMCVFSSLIFKHYLRRNIINVTIISTIYILIHGALQYLFYNAIWGYENVQIVYFEYILPSCFMTIVSVIIIYPFIRLIRRKLEPPKIEIIMQSRHNLKRL